MLESNEFIVLLLSTPAFIFMLTSVKSGDGPEYRDLWLLKAAFFLQLLAWLFTNIEALFWNEPFNCLEHICESASALLMLVWLVRLLRGGKEKAT